MDWIQPMEPYNLACGSQIDLSCHVWQTELVCVESYDIVHIHRVPKNSVRLYLNKDVYQFILPAWIQFYNFHPIKLLVVTTLKSVNVLYLKDLGGLGPK